MSTEKKPRKPRVVAPKTALELELEKGFEHAKELTTATKQVARIIGKFNVEEQQQIISRVWAFAKSIQPAVAADVAADVADEPEDGQPGDASGN